MSCSAWSEGAYTVTMAAKPVRRSRSSGSRWKLLWSHTPVRTEGSASSSNTAATPPMNRLTGLSKISQEMLCAGVRAGAP